MARKRLTRSIAAGMLVGALTQATPASADSTSLVELLPAGVPLSSLLLTPPVMSGTVQTPAGTPGPAAVTLYAWPSDETLQHLVVGDQVNVQPIAAALAGADGHFDLRLPSLTSLAPFVDDAGSVDLEAVARDANGDETSWNFSRKLATPSGSSMLDALNAGTATLTEPLTGLAATAQNVNMRLATGSTNAAHTPTATFDEATGNVSLKGGCAWFLAQIYNPVWTAVGATWSSTSGIAMDFQYSTGASSSLGVGVSASGAYGSWTTSGTLSKSSTTTVDFPTASGAVNRIHRTQYQYARYSFNCGATAGKQEARPYKYVSGASDADPGSINATYCTTFASGSTFTKNSTTAITWSNGVNMGSIIGVDFSSETGFTTTAQIKTTFSATHKLCGAYDYPGGTPYMLQAKA